ncbi:transglycosylase domain-containing protein [Dyadobacter pollutisoli]|uniref:Transglycosylase domain-containing protein n=1 Tax=Dyadobacter pollutisoli TaxID=2910158 RepID=A0A9E8SKW6_9BACT|nr:transglycosylase domain-containing protein [Dyadobacter pollutisoli]WAC12393.1 transglycosylase domain-containing protein [Dyadobacter pollutisoli]
MMLLLLALISYIFLLGSVFLLLPDFWRFLIRKTFRTGVPQTFVDLGQIATTFVTVCCISVVGILFYKFSVAFTAHLLSNDLVSFFIQSRGVYKFNSDLQSPLSFDNLVTGLLFTPALQFLASYLIIVAIRSVMMRFNSKYGEDKFSEGDVLCFGLVSVFLIMLTEVIFYTQKISGLSGIAHLLYLAADKISTICYFLAITHIHLLKTTTYRISLPSYTTLNAVESKVIFSPIRTVLLTYGLGVCLHVPFFCGAQFYEDTLSVAMVLLLCTGSFFFVLRVMLSKGFNYLGVVMLSEKPEYLLTTGRLISQATEITIWICLAVLSVLLLFLKPEVLFFLLFFIATGACVYIFIHIVTYLSGYTVSVLWAKKYHRAIPNFQVAAASRFLGWMAKVTLIAIAPMFAFICSAIVVFGLWPVKFHNQNENYINSVVDELGNPIFIESKGLNDCIPIAKSEVPEFFLKCLFIQEDRDFNIQYALSPNLSNWHGVSLAMFYRFISGGGGSNLNAQLVKNNAFQRSFPQDVQRKFSEAIASFQLSFQSHPDQIVTQYLNRVGLNGGAGHSGVSKASLATFGQPLNKLNALEMMYLISTLKAGSVYKIGDKWIKTRDTGLYRNEVRAALLSVARRWFEQDLITPQDLANLGSADLRFINEPFNTRSETTTNEFLKKEIDKTPLKGKTFVTSISLLNQRKVTTAYRRFHARFQQNIRLGEYNLYAAALVVDVKKGHIIAHYGGEGVTELTRFSEGNPVGSIIKPFVILEMLEDGWKPDQIKLFDGRLNDRLTPNNYSKRFSEKYVGIEKILSVSLNAPMANISEITDPIDLFKNIERRFLRMNISEDRSLNFSDRSKRMEYELNYPLGSRRMTLYEIAQAYQTLFNDGNYIELTSLLAAYDPDKDTTTNYTVIGKEVYGKLNTQIIRRALEKTMLPGGTGTHIRDLLPQNKRFYAKTGTSDQSTHGYTVLCDGQILVVTWTSYGKVEKGRLELNETPPIPFGSGVRTAGVFGAMIYSELQKN